MFFKIQKLSAEDRLRIFRPRNIFFKTFQWWFSFLKIMKYWAKNLSIRQFCKRYDGMECVESNPCLGETFYVFNGGNFMFFTTYIENLDELCNLEIRPSEPHPGCCSSVGAHSKFWATLHITRDFFTLSSWDAVKTILVMFWAILWCARSKSLAWCKTSGKRGYIAAKNGHNSVISQWK